MTLSHVGERLQLTLSHDTLHGRLSNIGDVLLHLIDIDEGLPLCDLYGFLAHVHDGTKCAGDTT